MKLIFLLFVLTPGAFAGTFKVADCTGTLDLGDMGMLDLRSTITLASPTEANMEFEMLQPGGWTQFCITTQPMSVSENHGVYLLHGDLNCRDGSGKNTSIAFDSVKKTFFVPWGFGATFTCALQ